MKWLPFCQAVISERVKEMGAEELEPITRYIEDRFQKEVEIYERPWDAFPGGENESEAMKKKKYLRR